MEDKLLSTTARVSCYDSMTSIAAVRVEVQYVFNVRHPHWHIDHKYIYSLILQLDPLGLIEE
jgi:hypothetical protein